MSSHSTSSGAKSGEPQINLTIRYSHSCFRQSFIVLVHATANICKELHSNMSLGYASSRIEMQTPSKDSTSWTRYKYAIRGHNNVSRCERGGVIGLERVTYNTLRWLTSVTVSREDEQTETKKGNLQGKGKDVPLPEAACLYTNPSFFVNNQKTLRVNLRRMQTKCSQKKCIQNC